MPDDFRCKFTSHLNYTSGVLTVPRLEVTNPPVQQTINKLTQHELELASLRHPANSYHL
jgi:hypothetical protein